MQARRGSAGCVVLALVLTACQQDSLVGKSGSAQPGAPANGAPVSPPIAAQPSAVPPAKAMPPRMPSLFSSKGGEDVGSSNPYLGDIDGDGFDDFFILALLPQPLPTAAPGIAGNQARIYLFYGRADFPTRLSTENADAVFESFELGSGPLGDINGDGYADFVISRIGSIEIIFGSPQRLVGMVAEGTAGLRWTPVPAPSIYPAPYPTALFPYALGDYNGDGYADLGVNASRLVDASENDPPVFGFLDQSVFLVLGHGGSWPEGQWDPSWAVARFGYDFEHVEPGGTRYRQSLTPIPAGDLDADGFDDLLVHGPNGAYLFYGGRPLTGVVSVDQADATIPYGDDSGPPLPLGDADGDGAADLLVAAPDSGIGVVYGTRWSGRGALPVGLSIYVAGVGGSREPVAAAGDIDGDGLPEIVVAAAMAGRDAVSDVPRPPAGALYVIRGTGSRALGEYHLNEGNLLLRGPKAGAPAGDPYDSGLGWTLSMTGDVDGDGGRDILTSSPGAITSAQSLGAVFLVPSTPRMPL
jgi:hypothetical protein